MTGKRIAVVQTRCTDRPLHGEFVRNVTKLDWVSSPADLFVATHGKGEPEYAVLKSPTSQVRRIINCHKQSNGRIGWLTNLCLNMLLPPEYGCTPAIVNSDGNPYEFVVFLDDDAYFRNPTEAMTDLLGRFDLSYQIAACGPIDGYRILKRYKQQGIELRYFNEFVNSPFATLGAQMYRTEHLATLSLDFLEGINFRGDLALFMLLASKDFLVGECVIRFQHNVSGGLDQKVPDIAMYERRLKQTEQDHCVIHNELNVQHECDTNRLVELEKQLGNAIRAERNHSLKRIDSLKFPDAIGVGNKEVDK